MIGQGAWRWLVWAGGERGIEAAAMNKDDFGKLIGAQGGNADYLPVAMLLCSGYGCAGYFSATLNDGLVETCVLVNVRLVEFERAPQGRPSIENFTEFLEEIVRRYYESDAGEQAFEDERYGRYMALTAVPYDQIAVCYPVAAISKLLQRLDQATQEKGVERPPRRLPAFLDLDRSEIIRVLRVKLW
jgi:hypothetical protein